MAGGGWGRRVLQLFLGKPQAWLLVVLRLSGAVDLAEGGRGVCSQACLPGFPTQWGMGPRVGSGQPLSAAPGPL